MTMHALRMKAPLCAAALAIAAIAPVAAHASGTAATKLTDVRIQLIDLDANDGITPGITFDTVNGTPAQLIVDALSGGTPLHNSVTLPTGTYHPLGLYFATTYASATMTAGDAFGAPGAGLGASVESVSSGANDNAWALGNPLPRNFTLTANTRMVVTASVATYAYASLGDTATAYGSLWVADMSWNDLATAVSQRQVKADGTTWLIGGTSLQASFDNLGPNAFAGHLTVAASAYTTSVTAVPEPQNAALLLAGLAVLGAGAARCRSQGR